MTDVFVGCLPIDIKVRDLDQLFIEHGEILEIKLHVATYHNDESAFAIVTVSCVSFLDHLDDIYALI